MSKYKIGDRVRVINGIGKLQDAMRGRIGTVAAVHEIDGVQHCWVLIDGFDNPHKVDPTIAFHYNQLAPWLGDNQKTSDAAITRYVKYKNSMKQMRNQNNAVSSIPEIKSVIYSDPATIVFWKDGTKTVVKCNNEGFDHEKGLAIAFSKKMFGNKGNYYNVFKKWLPEEKPSNSTIPLSHEIQDVLSCKRKKSENKCQDCIYGDDLSYWRFCALCVNGDEWRPKK